MCIASVRDTAEPYTTVLKQCFALPGMFLDHKGKKVLKIKSFYPTLMACKQKFLRLGSGYDEKVTGIFLKVHL